MQHDILVLGSINMDVVVKGPKFPEYGHTISCDSIHMIPGGKGANQAVTVARLGKKVLLIGAVGKDSAGDQLLSYLKSQNVDTTQIIQVEKQGSGIFVALIDETGENTMVGTKGANDCITDEDVVRIFESTDAKILLIQMETSKESILSAMKIAKERGLFVILDPAPAENIFEEAFQYADLIMPNKQETERMTGIQVVDEETALKAAAKIHALGVPNIIIKMGENGSLVYQNGNTTFVDPIKIKAMNTVGAGDCFAGAMACEFLETEDLIASAKFASIAAGIKVSKTGGHDAIPTLDEVRSY